MLGPVDVAHAALAEQLEQLVRAEDGVEAMLGIVDAARWRWWWSRRPLNFRPMASARRFDLRSIFGFVHGIAGADRERWMQRLTVVWRELDRLRWIARGLAAGV